MTTRIGYLSFPQLAVQVAVLRHPTLRGRPVILGTEGHGRVVDASADCRVAGVTPGMAVREALELIPGATCLPPVPERDGDVLDRALDLLERFSEVIEADALRGAWFIPAGPLDERRLAAAIVDALAASLSLDGRVGLASGKFVARLAADDRATDPVVVIAADSVLAYLAPRPITVLPLRPQAIERLRLLGISTIGEFARLPADAIPRRFGREALAAHRIALGHDETILVPRLRPETRTTSRTFEPPVEDRAILLATATDVLKRLFGELQERQHVCRTLCITVGLEDGRRGDRRADLRQATNEVHLVRPVLERMVEALTLDRAVASLTLTLSGIGTDEPRQGELFDDAALGRSAQERRARVVDALAEVSLRYRGRLRKIVMSDDPENLLDDRRLLLVPYVPEGGSSKGSSVTTTNAESAIRTRPIRLTARGARIYLRDPQRSDGHDDPIIALHARWVAEDWWPEAARRTYYRIRTESGLVATLACDQDRQRWLLVETLD